MQIFGVLQSVVVVILLSLDLMAVQSAAGIVLKKEQFFIEEEKEKRLEEIFEADLDNAFENKHVPKEEIPEEGAVALAGKKTQETLTATDLIIERLDIAEAENQQIAEHQVYTCRELLQSKY
ncbi:hypothetical protein Lalb_Chr20g0112421 [Lupinus albus]|uniref:Uncharacterized protein n=1 Tax=Lupinus albus TaxID=3870 RepID=A0A6A4NT96_LUPAL|nr:hypothetical protein Lalb_Chr20g0112421 [Lupinus albus]